MFLQHQNKLPRRDVEIDRSLCGLFLQVKTDMVLLMLKKATEKKTWGYVTEREKKKKEKQ